MLFCGAILFYDGLMVISRVYLGEHWTTDVVGGAILGTACGLFVTVFLVSNKKGEPHQSEKKSLFPKFKVEIKRVE